jgi:valyl-tRNA synthetase
MLILENYEGKVDLSKFSAGTELADEWIMSVFYHSLKKYNKALDTYNYSLGADIIWDFIWNNFCDWYIEISKIDKEKSLPTLLFLLTNSLKLLHPYMPFITEAIWDTLAKSPKIQGLDSKYIINAAWPQEKEAFIKSKIEKQMGLVVKVVREIRNLRKQLSIAPGKECQIILVSASSAQLTALKLGSRYIERLAKISSLEFFDVIKEKPKGASSSVVEDTQIFLPLAGVVDIAQESERLKKKLTSLEDDLAFVFKKLSNEKFLEKAPSEVVEKIQKQKEDLISQKALIEKQLTFLIAEV